MLLEEIRTLLLSERETGRLTSIPPDTYDRIRDDLEALTTEVYSTEDPFSNRTRVLIERASSIRETLEDLFRIRSEKILALAAGYIDGQLSEKEEMKKMLTPERELFESVTAAIQNIRDHVIISCQADSIHPKKPFISLGHDDEEPAIPDTTAPLPVPGYILARVLSDMEPFMGVDGRIYHLMKEDVVTLPKRNADVLHEREIITLLQQG
jgi:DNA replication factor GINS